MSANDGAETCSSVEIRSGNDVVRLHYTKEFLYGGQLECFIGNSILVCSNVKKFTLPVGMKLKAFIVFRYQCWFPFK